MKNHRVDKFIKNPKKALITLSMPVMVGMLVQTLYNIVDTAWVGRLGAESIAALTFAFPLFFILISVNSGIGIGMSSRISRLIGMKQKDAAENTAIHGLIICVVLGLLITIAGIFSLDPLFALFGAAPDVIPLATQYMGVILIGIVFMFPSYMMNSIFAAQGDTKTPMKVQIAALILNAILDPIFIYTFGLGVQGAAIATVIAFAFSLVLFIYYINKKSYLKIRLCCYKFRWNIIREILAIGVPATLMMLLMSIYIMFINSFMAHYGTEYVASFGLASRLESLAVMPIVAISLSTTTLVAMFYGAKRKDLVKGISWYGIKLTLFFTSLVGLIFFIIPGLLFRIFTSDQMLIDIGIAYMRLEVFTFPLMAFTMMVARIAQGLGTGMPGFMINVVRVLFVGVPMAYLFVYVLQWSFIWIAVALIMGGIASSIIALIWLQRRLRRLTESIK